MMNYMRFTQEVSVNKILNELDEKNLEFTSKINEFISSNQTKALTIPGALIAAGGLVKANETTEAILIIAGLWMIKKSITFLLRYSMKHSTTYVLEWSPLSISI